MHRDLTKPNYNFPTGHDWLDGAYFPLTLSLCLNGAL
jgi:hypothetical protein